MPLILPGNVASATDTGYSIANSVRYNPADSPDMALTFGTPTDNLKWTWSGWIKKCVTLSGDARVISDCYDSGLGGGPWIMPNDFYRHRNWYGSYDRGNLTTNQKLRDVSSWYHIVQVYDSANATAGNRMRLYINGVEVTSFSTDTNPAEDQASSFNSAIDHHLGSYRGTGDPWDGYLAEIVFCDGQAYAASDFGEFNEDSPTIWQPKDPSGLTFGDNGFWLDFEDSSALGDDVSGKGNDWTPANLAAINQCQDSPTNNFATLNSLEIYASGATLIQGNCKMTTGGNEIYSFNNSTIAVSSGKWYAEVKVTTTTTDNANMIGISAESPIYLRSSPWGELGDTAYAYAYVGVDGAIRNNGSETSHGDSYSTSVIGIYLDLDNNKLYFGKDGTIQNSGTGVSITAAASTPTGHYFISAGNYHNNAAVFEVNFGNPVSALSSAVADANGYGNFEYDPSDGGGSSFDSAAKDFLALCTKNLGSDGG